MYIQPCANPQEAPRHYQREGQRMRREMKNIKNSTQVSSGSYSLKKRYLKQTINQSAPAFDFMANVGN